MKLSIFLPHLDRSALLFKTLTVYQWFLSELPFQYELLVAEDGSNHSERVALCMLDQRFGVKVHHVTRKHGGSQSVIAMNELAERAQGDVFIISGAETYPAHGGFIDRVESVKPGEYRVGAVWALSPLATMKLLSLPVEQHPASANVTTVNTGRGEWYQHSEHRNRQLHFFSMIHREDWFKVGGMPREHENSVGKEDVAFLANVKKAGINVVSDDSMLAYHQNHYGGLYTNGHDPFRKWGI